MDAIYHEKQEGQLCAQHCLNNLLQGSYCNPVQLAGIANRLDEAEKERLIEGDVSTAQVVRVMQQPSSNMDDSGFFSVQVIADTLKVWSLEIVPLTSQRMREALDNPCAQKAFICNHQLHWFTIRKFGSQWFNLDSLLNKPEFVSDTYLSLFLAQLTAEGYSIHVVLGSLPSSEADELLSLIPYQPSPQVTTEAQSLPLRLNSEDEFENNLAQAIHASLTDQHKEEATLSTEELRSKRLKHFK